MVHDFPLNQNRSKNFETTILIVDDQEIARRGLINACRELKDADNIQILTSTNIPDAIKVLSTQRVSVAIVDKNLGPDTNDPLSDGVQSISKMLNIQPTLQILIYTGNEDIQEAVVAVKRGAFGFICKTSPIDLLICQIQQAISMSNMVLAKTFTDRGQNQTKDVDLGGVSKAMKAVFKKAKTYSDSNSPVLLLGETGVGKTTLAMQVHSHREKAQKKRNLPFVAVNIGAIPATLVESELFGHEKGAFTGANTTKQGLVELANHGTLFLDEIGDASPDIQLKLLRVLAEKKFRRLSGNTELTSEFKLVCATHRDLEKRVKEGLFREDLYMRISTLSIKVPPLSERKEDIPDIVKAALPQWCITNKVYVSYDDLPEDFIHYLMNTPFPGNIRGIERVVTQLLVSAEKDENGRPDFTQWREALEIGESSKESNSERSKITLKELMTLPLDVVGEGFPGIPAVTDSVRDRIILDAIAKHKHNNAIAKALKMSTGNASMRLKPFESLIKTFEGEKDIHPEALVQAYLNQADTSFHKNEGL